MQRRIKMRKYYPILLSAILAITPLTAIGKSYFSDESPTKQTQNTVEKPAMDIPHFTPPKAEAGIEEKILKKKMSDRKAQIVDLKSLSYDNDGSSLIISEDLEDLLVHERITLDLPNANIKTLLERIFEPYGVMILFDDTVDTSVTANIRVVNETLKRALKKYLNNFSFHYAITGDSEITVSAMEIKFYNIPMPLLKVKQTYKMDASGEAGANIEYSHENDDPTKDLIDALKVAVNMSADGGSSSSTTTPSTGPKASIADGGTDADTTQTILDTNSSADSGLAAAGTVTLIATANKIMVKGTREQQAVAQSILDSYENMYSNVITIDVEVIEANRSDLVEYGLAGILKSGNVQTASPWSTTFQAGSDIKNLTLDPNSAAIFATSKIAAAITAMANDNKAKIIARPTMQTISGYTQTFNIGSEKSFVGDITRETSTVDPATGATTPGATSITWEKILDGLEVSVTPKYNEGAIEMLIFVSKENLLRMEEIVIAGDTFRRPVSDKKTTLTLTKVKSGESVVIAGFTSKTESSDKNGLPWLSKVPFLNNILGSTKNEGSGQELIIIATPRVRTVK